MWSIFDERSPAGLMDSPDQALAIAWYDRQTMRNDTVVDGQDGESHGDEG
jgi:hypothetical protein